MLLVARGRDHLTGGLMTSTRAWMTVGVSAAAVCLLPTAAAADQTYLTQKYPLTAVGDAPLAKGSVINTHANGPVVYGNERYSLVGAEPTTTYQVALVIYGDARCTTPVLVFPTATLTTNRVGNGHATARFYAQDVAPLVPAPTTVAARGPSATPAASCTRPAAERSTWTFPRRLRPATPGPDRRRAGGRRTTTQDQAQGPEQRPRSPAHRARR